MSASRRNHVQRRRETDRRRRLREALESTYRGQAVLLDELRWRVVGEQMAERADENARRSLLNSFARTVREQLTNHLIKKIAISPDTPVGLVARAAVYRMKDIAVTSSRSTQDSVCWRRCEMAEFAASVQSPPAGISPSPRPSAGCRANY